MLIQLVRLILKYFKQFTVIFLFSVFVSLNVNHSRDDPLGSNERSSIVYVSLRGGDGKTQSTTFLTTLPDAPTSPGLPALPDPKYIGEQPIDIQGIKEISPEFGYKTAFAGAGGKKLPDTPSGGNGGSNPSGGNGGSNPSGGNGNSWNPNNQNTNDKLAWRKVQKNPDTWNGYQEHCQKQSKKNQRCDLIEIESKINEDPALIRFAEEAGKDTKVQRDLNNLTEQLRLGSKSPGSGTITLFKGVKESRSRRGARLYFRNKNGKVEILAKSNKAKKNQQAVIKILREKYE